MILEELLSHRRRENRFILIGGHWHKDGLLSSYLSEDFHNLFSSIVAGGFENLLPVQLRSMFDDSFDEKPYLSLDIPKPFYSFLGTAKLNLPVSFAASNKGNLALAPSTG